MKTNNKTRANRWEREASKLLSIWISGHMRKDLFWRTNSSGAKGTVTGEKGHCGDIVATDPAGVEFARQFYVECKWKKDFCYADLGTMRSWIAGEGAKAKKLEKSLLMLIKGKGGEIYVLVNVSKRSGLRRYNIPTSDAEYLIIDGHAVSRIGPLRIRPKKRKPSTIDMEATVIPVPGGRG